MKRHLQAGRSYFDHPQYESEKELLGVTRRVKTLQFDFFFDQLQTDTSGG